MRAGDCPGRVVESGHLVDAAAAPADSVLPESFGAWERGGTVRPEIPQRHAGRVRLVDDVARPICRKPDFVEAPLDSLHPFGEDGEDRILMRVDAAGEFDIECSCEAPTPRGQRIEHAVVRHLDDGVFARGRPST